MTESRDIREKLSLWVRQPRLDPRPFTIISDDCWAGQLYQDFSLPYRTPFVGLFVPPEMYLRMLTDLPSYLGQPLVFRAREEKPEKYPVAHLKDIDIHFMHYHSEQEAREKWERRKQRIVWDRLFVKWDAGKTESTEAMRQCWNRLPYANKICFLKHPEPNIDNSVLIPDWDRDGASMYWLVQERFDPLDWLRGGSGRKSLYQRIIFYMIHDPNLKSKICRWFHFPNRKDKTTEILQEHSSGV